MTAPIEPMTAEAERCIRSDAACGGVSFCTGDVRNLLATIDALRAEVAEMRTDLADARAWLDAGPDDPASIQGVVERLMTCGAGPTPEGYTESCCIVGRIDVREIVRIVAAQAKVIACAVPIVEWVRDVDGMEKLFDAYDAARAALGAKP